MSAYEMTALCAANSAAATDKATTNVFRDKILLVRATSPEGMPRGTFDQERIRRPVSGVPAPIAA
jgi:hypothetical protein